MSRATAFAGFTLLCLAAALLLPAMPQPLDYHDFADHREVAGIANFLDVTSNLGFLIVAVVGLAIVFHRDTPFAHPAERWPYAVFFIGMLLTALGSAYYHLAPDNERLFWDRLPMTVAFMSLIAAQIAERVSLRIGLLLLTPMVLLGVATVVYWLASEESAVTLTLGHDLFQYISGVFSAGSRRISWRRTCACKEHSKRQRDRCLRTRNSGDYLSSVRNMSNGFA